MSEILCVTNRALCREPFLRRVERIAEAKPAGIILREKDLPEAEYGMLADAVLRICQRYATPCILHGFVKVAAERSCSRLHLPMDRLRSLPAEIRSGYAALGASCHCAQDAMEAEALGCTYITAGHIFDTACKKGVPGRGLAFLKDICQCVSIPVYAIGGISARNIGEVSRAGAAGACVMSGAMVCEDVRSYLSAFKEE